MSGVAPAKSDLVFGKRDQAMVGDGHAMGVAAQILEHILGAAKGWFRVDHPVFSEQGPQPGGEDFRLSQPYQVSGELELAFLEGALESGNELAAEDAAKNFDGKKEPVT